MTGADVLILEDSVERMKGFYRRLVGNNVVHVETPAACIAYLKKGGFDVLFLDHDLGGQVHVPSGPGTGYEVAVWLEENPQYQPEQIFVHSLDPVGSKNILAALPKAQAYPFAWMHI